MSWAIGYDEAWKRDIGYGVPAYCDHPDCKTEIDRGLGYVCGEELGGGEHGCGLFFCSEHQVGCRQTCACCAPKKSTPPFKPSADHPGWIAHKLTDESWHHWRDENPGEVAAMIAALRANPIGPVQVQRDEGGWWSHPSIPDFNESAAAWKAWRDAQGIETKFVLLEDEDLDHPAYIAYFDQSDNDVTAWNPAPPAGPGWFVFSIHDTEDGPVFCWARRIEDDKHG